MKPHPWTRLRLNAFRNEDDGLCLQVNKSWHVGTRTESKLHRRWMLSRNSHEKKNDMKQWEYKYLNLRSIEDDYLNKLGLEGWELVAAVTMGDNTVNFFFKREK